MTNIGKALITGLLLVDLGFTAYILAPKSNRSAVETDARINSFATTAAVDFQSADAHVVVGNVAGTVLPAKGSSDIAAASRPVVVAVVAPKPDLAVKDVAQDPPAEAQLHEQPAHTRESADVKASFGSKASPVPRDARGREGPQRRGSNPVATAMTAELVKESAKLDPALPPPDRSGREAVDRRGSNPVAAAMTDELVRQSTRPGPAPQSASQSGSH
jgi:hypothetical protein